MKRIHNFLIVLILVIVSSGLLSGQDNKSYIEGAITFVTKKNVYIKFNDTENIKEGDTIFIKVNDFYIPALIISIKSSVSVLCSSISDKKYKKGQKVYAKFVTPENKNVDHITEEKEEIPKVNVLKGTKVISVKEKSSLRGRFTISTNSNIAGFNDNTGHHRFRYIFALKGENLINSKFYFDHYISFNQTYRSDFTPSEKINDKLRFYRVTFGYKNEGYDISFGRQIKNKVSALGSFDGLYIEKRIKNDIYTGVIAGARPDYHDYGFNSDLLQYGAFVSYFPDYKKSSTRGTIAFFEQHNGSAIDRRFLYAQFSTSLSKKLKFFGASEIDLYQLKNGIATNDPKLTNIYGNLNYRLNRKLNFSLGFDSRKNRIYYETYKDFLETIIERETRQGLRFRLGYKPFKKVSFSVMSNFRFQDKVLSSKYYNAMVYLRRIPLIKSNISLSANVINTSYLDSKSLSLRISKRLRKKVSFRLEYKYYQYLYSGTNSTRTQSRVGGSANFNLLKSVYFSIYYEKTLQKDRNYSRLNLRLTKRF